MRKALVVGIDNYSQCPLRGCCNDADEVAKLLSCNDDGSPNFAVKLQKNISTKAILRKHIEECFSGDADVALFYYSGHGHIDNVGGYLVTPDFTNYDYGVSLQDVLNIANASRCKDKIIILDSCHSGFMGSISTAGQSTAVINEGVTILTASRSIEASVEINGHGLFTSLLIEALCGSAAVSMEKRRLRHDPVFGRPFQRPHGHSGNGHAGGCRLCPDLLPDQAPLHLPHHPVRHHSQSHQFHENLSGGLSAHRKISL